MIQKEEMPERHSANKLTVKATIESSSEDGDDLQEEGLASDSGSVPNIPDSIEHQDMKEGQTIGELKDEDEDTPTIIERNHMPNLRQDSYGSCKKENFTTSENANRDSETISNASESIPADSAECIANISSTEFITDGKNDNVEETHSTKSTSSKGNKEDSTKDTISNKENPNDDAQWNMEMANMKISEDSRRSISNASSKSEQEKISVDGAPTAQYDTQMSTTTDTFMSKENVKIEVTKGVIQSSLSKSELSFESESVDVNLPMPAPRTVTPISEVCIHCVVEVCVWVN